MSLKKVGTIALTVSQFLHEAEASEHTHEEPAPENPVGSQVIAERPSASHFYSLYLRTGAVPENKTAPDSGTLLSVVGINRAAVAGEGPIINSGAAGHFRIKNVNGKTVHQGSVTATGEGGGLTFDNTACVGGGVIAAVFSSAG